MKKLKLFILTLAVGFTTATTAHAGNLIPILECVKETNPNSWTAYFTYISKLDVDAKLPVGPGNFFAPAPFDRGQLTVFAVQKEAKVYPANDFAIVFSKFPLIYTLNGTAIKIEKPDQFPCPADPVEPICGNGIKEDGEECDGEADCSKDCKIILPFCGDGQLDEGEECDEGANNGQGLCDIECKNVIIIPEPVCGNGKVEAGEECDGGEGCSDKCTVIVIDPVDSDVDGTTDVVDGNTDAVDTVDADGGTVDNVDGNTDVVADADADGNTDAVDTDGATDNQDGADVVADTDGTDVSHTDSVPQDDSSDDTDGSADELQGSGTVVGGCSITNSPNSNAFIFLGFGISFLLLAYVNHRQKQ